MRGLAAVPFVLALSACVTVPKPQEVRFESDVAELSRESDARRLDAAVTRLKKDPALHLLVVGHADVDHTDDYNLDLSRRRAEHVRDELLARDAELGPRIEVQWRSEWIPKVEGNDESAKLESRRVELRFHYPRVCEPALSLDFVACERARLPHVPPPEPPDEEAEPPPPPPEPEVVTWRGGYVHGLGGGGIASSDNQRWHAVHGFAAGRIWSFGTPFRLSVGGSFEHLVDMGLVFPPVIETTIEDRSALRAFSEVRVGGARGRLWAYARFPLGFVAEHQGNRVWAPGFSVGVGPGVGISLWRGLYLTLDSEVAYGFFGQVDAGVGIYGGRLGLGWWFDFTKAAPTRRSDP